MVRFPPAGARPGVLAIMPVAIHASVWPLLGWTLLAIAAVTVLRTIFDNARRWRRLPPRVCPRCAYDLSQSPGMTCSECGFAAQHESQLLRFRPRWRSALLALALLPMASLAFRAPDIAQRGWVAAVPTTALMLMQQQLRPMTYAEQYHLDSGVVKTLPWRKRLGNELLRRRLIADRMWRWQRRWVIGNAVRNLSWNGVVMEDDRTRRHRERESDLNVAVAWESLYRDDRLMDSLLKPMRDQCARDLVTLSDPREAAPQRVGLRPCIWMDAPRSPGRWMTMQVGAGGVWTTAQSYRQDIWCSAQTVWINFDARGSDRLPIRLELIECGPPVPMGRPRRDRIIWSAEFEIDVRAQDQSGELARDDSGNG